MEPKSKLKKVKIKSYAAEYLVDEFFLENLKNNTPLLCFYEKYVLVEIHFFGTLKLLEEAVFEMQNMGYTAVLAHPERYLNLRNESLINLKTRGVKLQLNALSLLGYYGPEINKKSSEWLTKGMYDFLGTDAHNEQHLKLLKNLKLSKKQFSAWKKVCESQLAQITI